MPSSARKLTGPTVALIWALLPVGAVTLPGCTKRQAATPVLRLYCGAGIRPPVAEMVEQFQKEHGVKIECDYAGSNILLSRIKLTRRGDLYMPGDARYVQQAERERLIAASVDACYFIPVILVVKGNPKKIENVPGLARPGVHIGFGDAEACAIGRVTDDILAKNHVDAAAIEENVVFRSLTVNELGLQIKAGKIDVTIVWDAIARAYLEEGEIVQIPPDKNVISTVPVAVLRSSEHPELAKAFQEFVTSERGRAIFIKHGYSTELPE